MRKSLILFLSLLLVVLVTAVPASAHHKAKILGAATDASVLVMPPTAEGPGVFQPDSPFFFLDEFKQNVRLMIAVTPEEKAKVYSLIAGERMAELRFMLSKNDKAGIETALEGVSENLKKSAEELSEAKLSGKDVSVTASKINTSIKEKQKTLDSLESQTDGEMQALITLISESLTTAKVEVEDSLPEQELENEIRDDLLRKASREVRDASDSAQELEDDLDELNEQATEAAKKALKNREEAIKKAIEQKNETLKKAAEKKFEAEKKKQEQLLEAQKKASEKAREAAKKAEEASIEFGKVQNSVNEIRNQAAESTSTNQKSEEDKKNEEKQREQAKQAEEQKREQEKKAQEEKED